MDQVTQVRRKPAGWAGLLVCLLPFIASLAEGQTTDTSLEYQVKAAFLLNFIKFIDWPPETFANAESPIAICIVGKDPFGAVLDEIVQGESINARRVAVQRVGVAPVPRACQIVFVGGSEKDIPKILGAVGRGVLTVGEGDRFLRDGGMVALIVDNRRVRFDINQAAAASAGLQLSARLLNVARAVEK